MTNKNNYDQFGSDYFENRVGNDKLRQLSFDLERQYIEKMIGVENLQAANILDVGCSTGEFYEAMKWGYQNKYGMEISEFARSMAESKGIKFDKDISNDNFFDLIIFRGTIQYLKNPFEYIESAYRSLKKGGKIIFLATPNANSIYFRKFKTLPFLEESLNYYIPTDISLSMNLKNVGFEIRDLRYPYLLSPYSRPIMDHIKFIYKLIFNGNVKFPFWRNMIWLTAIKK